MAKNFLLTKRLDNFTIWSCAPPAFQGQLSRDLIELICLVCPFSSFESQLSMHRDVNWRIFFWRGEGRKISD